jgi:hypothetical protein
MESEQQVKNRHTAMQVTPVFVGKLAPQGDQQHCEQQINGEFAYVFRSIAHGIDKPGIIRIVQFAGFAENRLYDIVTHFNQPMGCGEDHRQNAGPFMGAIDLVQPAQWSFKPGRAQRQHHRQGHQCNG